MDDYIELRLMAVFVLAFTAPAWVLLISIPALFAISNTENTCNVVKEMITKIKKT